jgi:leader peptidase (prepilin peptidase) / N-methyltransferase
MLMVIAALVVFGLCLGSFVNALVWRVRQQELEGEKSKPSKKRLRELSVAKGRSMCPHCGHNLAAKDLIPVLSWLSLRGKCRYCRKPISAEYPLVETATALIFVISYAWWPFTLQGVEWFEFGLWLVLLAGLVALLVYDLHWFLLPNRIMYPLFAIAGARALIDVVSSTEPLQTLIGYVGAVLVGGGIFYVIYQLSQGKWIGGGDVKLGWLLGLVVGAPSLSILFIFLAAVLGTLVTLPLLGSKRLKRDSLIPFGPFLIAGAMISLLFGKSIVEWYTNNLLAI